MNWLTEHSIWVLLGLIVFMAMWFVAFFARNRQAKNDHGTRFAGDTIDSKESGTTPIKRSSKV